MTRTPLRAHSFGVKPFATLGSEIGKVRDRVRASASALRVDPSVMFREQRERLLARLGEQTLMLIAERKLALPSSLREPVERLAALLGLELPSGLPSAPPKEPAPKKRRPRARAKR